MARSVQQAVRALALAGVLLVIESAAEPLPAQTCNDGGILVSTFAGAAFALSFFSTAVPIGVGVGVGNGGGAGVFLAGVVLGPSVGHFYAGQPVRGFVTAALRGAGTALFVTSIADCLFD